MRIDRLIRKIGLLLSLAVLQGLILPPLHANEVGKIYGAVSHPIPSWFKDSFLEIADDVDEATSAGKHVMLFFHLEACPYCTRMLVESFEPVEARQRIQESFDVIEINVKGDRLVQFTETLALTEKELAQTLNVQATPAIVFLNNENKFITRINGYRAPKRFETILDFVASKAYATTKLEAYLDKNLDKDVYQLRDHSLFTESNDLSGTGLKAVIVEDSSCHDCPELHDRMLGREDILEQLGKFTVLRLNADTDREIINLSGESSTLTSFLTRHEIIYRPAMLLIDDGQIVKRYDSLPFSYHFREGLRFVADGFYKKESYDIYSERRRDELLAAGIDINYKD